MKNLRNGLFSVLAPALIVSLLQPKTAYAWGEVGHETIAAIALQHLNPAVKVKVQNLMGNTDFVESALWADKIKYVASWCHTAPYHFADIPENEDYLDTLKSGGRGCSGKPDVVQALLKAESQLADSSNSKADRFAALKFMIHFVGDLHQPLHVGRPEDRGGNTISINWFDKKTNLHSVWDTYMIRSVHDSEFGAMSVPEQAAWYANYIDTDRGEAKEAVDPGAWLEDSLLARGSSYSGYDDEDSYQQKNIKLIERQLKAAGYRLASWLNLVLADSYHLSVQDTQLRSSIAAICPNFEDSIDLTEAGMFRQVTAQLKGILTLSRKKACSEEYQDLD